MGKLGFTPIIGLAVVVALAMVAVFGAMSLANPAQAQVADSSDLAMKKALPNASLHAGGMLDLMGWDTYVDGLAEADSLTVSSSDTDVVSLEAQNNIADDTTNGENDGMDDEPVVILDPATGDTVQLTVGAAGANGVAVGDDAKITVTFRDQNTSPHTVVTLEFTVTVAELGATGMIPTVYLPANGEGNDEEMFTVEDLGNYFTAIGAASSVTVASATQAAATVGGVTGTGIAQQFTITAAGEGKSEITVTAVNASANADDAVQKFMVMVGGFDVREVVPHVGSDNSFSVGDTQEIMLIKHISGLTDADLVLATSDNSRIASVSPRRDPAVASGDVITVTGVAPGTASITITAQDQDPTQGNQDADVTLEFDVTVVGAGFEVPEVPAGLPRFDADSMDPGKNTRYEIEFAIPNPTNTLINDLVIELPDYGVPASMSTSSVTITAGGYTFTPEDVSTDGEEIFISIGDVTEDTGGRQTGGVYTLGGTNHSMLVVFRQSAGITNPTGEGTYFAKIIFGTNKWEYDEEDPPNFPNLEDLVPRKVSLDEDEGGLGDVITATGKGYKDGTTLTVFVDKLIDVYWNDDEDEETRNVWLAPDDAKEYNDRVEAADGDHTDIGNVPNVPLDDDNEAEHVRSVGDGLRVGAPSGTLDLADDVLCAVAKIGKDDVGKCEFTITHPTFGGGLNYINAVDGRNGYDASPVTFDLGESIIASPTTGSPGETILVQVIDFTRGTRLDTVRIGRQYYCGEPNPFGVTENCPGLNVDASGSGNFSIDIPDWVRAGVQELKVVSAADDDASTNVTLLGPRIQVNPSSVLANQRISLIGTGFSPGAVIANDTDSEYEADHVMSVGGDPVDGNDINDGDPVTVDNGGNWSASVDLPLTEATTAEGDRTIRVTDSRGRTGVVIVNVPAREVTVTPDVGRVGTIALVSGKNFPSKNDEGEPINIDVIYETNTGSSTRVSALPDASGRFEVQVRIPTTSSIPSSNTITVGFTDQNTVPVVMTLPHEVPEGIVTTSVTSGGPGSVITVMGEGFKSFVPVSLVKIGTLDVTPAPKPSTDGNGMVSFDITIPGLDVGIQTIEVNVGRTTASVGFTVTESGLHPGNIVEVGAGLEDLGDNLVNIWHFNNDLKSWSFYDGMEGSDLTHLITGETYLIQIKSTMEVILNRDTRNLTCVGGNCWNQIVW